MSDTAEIRSERVDLRMTPAAKRTLREAAAATNRTLSEFLLDAGMAAANDALCDRRVFVLDEERWAKFMDALDNPPEDNPRLRRLLARKPAWEA
jgi:uncharacterized protein (DUF1778 family)